MIKTTGQRLDEIRDSLNLTIQEMSERLDIGTSTWKRIVSGDNLPKGETLVKLIKLGLNPIWILTGEGSMYLDDRGAPATAVPGAAQALNPVLLGRITDAIAAAYKEVNARISPRDLGILGAEKYSEIINASDDQEEWPVMIKLMASQLRKELTAPVSDNSKASA